MKLNRSTDMALRIAMLAAATPRRTTVDELAGQLALPRNHAAKVVQRLQRLGVLVTIRGRAGGVAFAADGGTYTVGQVVRAFEGDDEVVDCDGPACPLRAACRLRGELRRAQAAFLAVLDDVRLADLVDGPAGPLLLTLTAPPPLTTPTIPPPTTAPAQDPPSPGDAGCATAGPEPAVGTDVP
ncbi:transcriptional regulator, BadM/Rrf2 family [Micromonospora nigra]|uniref:Transcriptional regulator, BadM/Rrf2 family n=1 Tax=Micromonospora nigra TaxID=145857 RepID=A0A1C6ST46_9ACTN|nr:Rrf2 family transcriptional regulator [Micromonospora nigra]SCL32502.1 transcriptional regulator, BadM/Rrf2 family [Micromonospora nigra]